MTEKYQPVAAELEESLSSKSNISHRISREHIKSRYGDLIDSLPIIIYIVEPCPPYNPVYVSKGIEMLGYTQEDWHNTPGLWVEILHEDDRERVLDETRQALAEKSDTGYDYRLYARDGSIHWFHDKGHFVRDDDGEPISWEGFLLDITERKTADADEKNPNAEFDKSFAENNSRTILLVEDEEIIREMMREILTNCGYDVTTAENGIEALNVCEAGEKNFDLLITDFNMPQMNGRELAEKINASCRSTKILYISGYTDDDEFLQRLSTDGNYFIPKPFSPETLTSRVKELLDEE